MPDFMLDGGSLRLLACASAAVLLVTLLYLLTGAPASEANETRSWVLALALALPGGLYLAELQQRRLAAAAPAAAARALAGGAVSLAAGFGLLRVGVGGSLDDAVLIVAALAALAMPVAAARLWRDEEDRESEVARLVSLFALVCLALLFVPAPALEPARLLPALALAALGVLGLRFARPPRLGRPARAGLDLLACLVIALVVFHLPDLVPFAGDIRIHHLYFLGPANDVMHGRAMLGTAWSQYGTGAIDALGLAFGAFSLGIGTLSLIVAFLTVGAYLCAYAILRLAGLGYLLTLIALAVAALGSLFATVDYYVVFPSTSPLRFGIPYLIVLAAVIGARFPERARASQIAMLALLAAAAAWSFETFAYSAGAFGAVALVEALAAGEGAWRRVLVAALAGLGASLAALAAFSLATLALSGHLDWGPYGEYLTLYSTDEFFALPVNFFSAGPLMAATLFASAVLLLWLARASPESLAPPVRVALAGLTGFAIVTFTYYLGRSHPNNLLVLLLPVVAIGALWAQVALAVPGSRWRTAAVGAIALAMAMIAVAAWPSLESKGGSSALGLLVPGGRSLGDAYTGVADATVVDGRAPIGAALLDQYWAPGEPALVLTEPDLTTEVLIEAERRNLLPISHPPEDDLIDSSEERVRAAAERVPAGTLMLTSPPPAEPGPTAPAFSEIELTALRILHQRFDFETLWRDPTGFEVVRLR